MGWRGRAAGLCMKIDTQLSRCRRQAPMRLAGPSTGRHPQATAAARPMPAPFFKQPDFFFRFNHRCHAAHFFLFLPPHYHVSASNCVNLHMHGDQKNTHTSKCARAPPEGDASSLAHAPRDFHRRAAAVHASWAWQWGARSLCLPANGAAPHGVGTHVGAIAEAGIHSCRHWRMEQQWDESTCCAPMLY
jgi:hypothetical protein